MFARCAVVLWQACVYHAHQTIPFRVLFYSARATTRSVRALPPVYSYSLDMIDIITYLEHRYLRDER